MAGAFVRRQWSDMRPGDFVRDTTGRVWRLFERTALGDVTLENEAHKMITLPRQSGPVEWWDGDPNADGVEAFREATGGRIIFDQH